jgi:hypothetical protein
VLAGFQRRDGLPAVIRDRRIDVNGVDLRVAQQFLIIGVALLDAKRVAMAWSFFGVRWQIATRFACGCRW